MAITQREFIAYSFLAGMVLFGATMGVISLWFTFPRAEDYRVGRPADFPLEGSPYLIAFDKVSLYLINTGSGFIAFKRNTPHQTNNPVEWVALTHRFEDPLTGSKFAVDGTLLQGIAIRNLDRFPVVIEAGQVVVKTSQVILGEPRVEFMSCLPHYNDPDRSCWSVSGAVE